ADGPGYRPHRQACRTARRRSLHAAKPAGHPLPRPRHRSRDDAARPHGQADLLAGRLRAGQGVALTLTLPPERIEAMFIAKLRTTVVVFAVSVAVAHFGALTYRSPADQPAGLSLADFDKLHKELQPPKDELWRSIPWHVSIVEAREAAAKEKKPIFVWVASGEPLGCG